jgi:hypothetical protein
MQNEPIEVTLLVTGVFETLGIPYLIGGSLASTLYARFGHYCTIVPGAYPAIHI